MKTRESIEAKWRRKIEEMRYKADIKYSVILSRRKSQYEKNWGYEIEKNERKKQLYIKKKELEYRRKLMNEIREIENKPKREYVTDGPKIKPLQFALELAQENARLRDTDADGNGRCISCNRMCSWENLSWGHRYSRKLKHICLDSENINAQCRNCNWITWPKGNAAEKEMVNAEYDRNLDRRWWEWTAERLRKKVSNTFKWKTKQYDLSQRIPVLIDENEVLWASKNFYKPKKNWRRLWTEYAKRH